MLSIRSKFKDLNNMQLDHIQIGHVNKTEKFQKCVNNFFQKKRFILCVGQELRKSGK